MKKLKYLILCICLLALCALALSSCSTQLSTPSRPILDHHTQTLEWKPVKGASYYTVKFSDDLPEVTTALPSISLEDLAPGVYTIKIKARSTNEELTDSKWFSYEFERAAETGLKYQLINGGKEYQLVNAGTASGDVVMESVYRNKPVTSIAAKAFYNSKQITGLTVGENVTYIGDKAFIQCTSIEKVVITSNVTYIGECAFHSCKALKSVVLPDTLTTINPHTFAWCSSLETLKIGNALTTIGEYAFSNCQSLTSVTYNGLESTDFNINLPNTLKTIDTYAFTECKAFESIDIGDNVESLADAALESCASLKKVDLGNSIVTVGNNAFRYCTALTDVTIPDSTEILKRNAFYGCTALASVKLGTGIKDIEQNVFYNTAIMEAATDMLVIDGWLIRVKTFTGTVFNGPEGVFGIAGGALENLITMQQLNLPEVKYVGTGAFYNCIALYKATFSDNLLVLGEASFYNCQMLNSVTLGNSLQTLKDYAFYDCKLLGSGAPVVLPESLTRVGCRTFHNTNYYKVVKDGQKGPVRVGNWIVDTLGYSTPLSPIIIEDGVKGIADFTFVEEFAMQIYIADSVEYIGHGAFYLATASSITLPKNLKYIDDFAFYGCVYANFGGDTYSAVIPEGTTYIGRSAFYYCQSILSLTVPGTVDYIGKYAFYGCANLGATYTLNIPNGEVDENGYQIRVPTVVTGTLSLGDGIKHIDDRAFQNCTALTKLEIPNSVTTLGTRVFYNCANLNYASIGSGIDKIPDYMFYKCEKLETVLINDGVEHIGDYAFRGCLSLSTIDLGSVVSVGKYAFFGCSAISQIEIPDTMTSIDDYAFRGCTSLESIFIPESVQKIGKHAFYGMNKATIYTVHKSAPELWDSCFNSSYRPVVWGCIASEDGSHVASFTTGENTFSNVDSANVVISYPTRAGYVCKGWDVKPDSNTALYTAENVKQVESNVLLYSVWEPQTNDNDQTEG